jgi:hypothetical protein
MKELLKKYGEEWSEDRRDDFDLSESEKFVDFYNNGGLELHNNGVNYALVYAALYPDGLVQIGAWVWLDGEDFDQAATFEVYDEDDFSGGELDKISKRIIEIYGTSKK